MNLLPKTCFLLAVLFLSSKSNADDVVAEPLWRYISPTGACEIAAYSVDTQRVFVTTWGGVDVVDLATADRVESLKQPSGHHATSVACSGGVVAIPWAADDKSMRGKISLYDARQLDVVASYSAGYLPDMLTFTPDGKRLLVANEGEPNDDYSFDPEGSITIITAGKDWRDATLQEALLASFDPFKAKLIADGVRIFGPNQESPDGLASVAQDIEPEYIAVGADSKMAWITLQENNAIAELDVERAEIVSILPLGQKDFGCEEAAARECLSLRVQERDST